MTNLNIPSNVTNQQLIKWVTEMVELCKPSDVVWCDGSQEEYDRLCEEMVETGTFIRSIPKNARNSFWRARIRRM
jgi:phosphoenolpyruvate carboxykinase (GTP)